jgi:hypothetical protein
MSKITQSQVETLARIDAVGIFVWLPGELATLNDASASQLNIATAEALIRDGYLDEAEDSLIVSEAGKAELARHPEIRGRARSFYEGEAALAAAGFRSAEGKPDFKRAADSSKE